MLNIPLQFRKTPTKQEPRKSSPIILKERKEGKKHLPQFDSWKYF
jgi:hypothetical protein